MRLHLCRSRRSQYLDSLVLRFYRRQFSLSSKSESSTVAVSYNVYEPPGSKIRGTPLLMGHGLLGSKQNWNTVAKAVARDTNRKIISFDARNHGDSPHANDMSYDHMAEDVAQLTNQLEIEKFCLLGHSMGGRTVMAFALKHPEKMDKLVVVDMSPFSMAGEFQDMKGDSVSGFLETLQSITFDPSWPLSQARKHAEEKLKAVTADAGVRAFLLTNLAKGDSGPYWKPNLPVLLENVWELKKFPDKLLSSKSTVPTLFIRGGKSAFVPDGDIPKIQSVFTNSQIATLENSGHWPHADNPNKFIPILVNFLNAR